MRKATLEEIKKFTNYRANHVALVQRIGKVVFDKDFSNHDHDKIEGTAEELNLWALRNAMINGDYHPNKEDKKELQRIAAKHQKTQSHHPAYWDNSVSIEDLTNDENTQIDATKMSKKALLECVADWAAVAIKLNKALFSYFNDKCMIDNPQIIFTNNQKEFFIENTRKILEDIPKEKLYWLGKEYTAKQVEPLKELNEKIIKSGSKWKVTDHTGSKNLGTYNTKKDAEKRLQQVEYFKHINEKLDSLKESILDIPQKEYSKDLLTSNDKMKPEVRKQILDTIDNWKDQINFNFEVKKILAKGSLLSKRYNDSSDLDVTIMTDMSKEQLDSIFDIIPKGQNIEGTDHPLDFYILIEGEETPERNLDNIYDVKNDGWIKRTDEYENEIPLDYIVQVCNFFINGSKIALSNYENDKILYEYYKSLDSSTHEISEEELNNILEDKKRDLKADLDALKIAVHMIGSFRQEAYEEEDSNPFKLSIEVSSDNPHLTANEQLVKVLEKFGIREALRDAIKACEELLGESETLKEELSSGNFNGMIPEHLTKIVEPIKPELKESTENRTAAYIFGRMNPPSIGHLLLLQTLANTKADAKFVYASHTQDNKKNPLDYNTKAAYIEEIIAINNLDIEFVNSNARTFIDAAVDIYDKGYKNLIIVAGGDRIEELLSLLRKYNNVSNKEGKAYHFDSIEGENAGDRDPDSEGVSGASGTKMRQFIKDNDFKSFIKYSPIKDLYILKDVFDTAKKNLLI